MPTPSPGSRRLGAFANALRRLRESAGLTQAELAERAGIGVRTVSNLERGINTSPYPSTVRVLADALALPEESRAELLKASRRTEAPDGTASRPTGGFLGSLPAGQLVARDGERAAIADALSAVADGEGRVVLLAGEPGIGKTRLAQETSAYAEERGFVVATGRCYQPQSGTPFTPWLEALAALHDAAPPGVRGNIDERWPALASLLPDQFPSAPPEAGPAADAVQRLHRAAAGFVRELATDQPVAILLDDLHWADGASLELLAHLGRHTRGERVLLLGTYRNVDVGRSHLVRELAYSLRRDGVVEEITVDRLDRAATTGLITDHLDDAPVSEEFSALVHRHADGNPFFTVEILNALIERGDLSHIGGQWVRRELADIEAPASVNEAIGERVSHLSLAAQRLLEVASVLGEVFDLAELEDLGIDDAGEEAFEQAFDEAVASGLLATAEGRYGFDHALTQHALYAGLSPVRRRRLHRVVGERLESRPPATRARRSAEIARHLEAGGLPDRAIPFVLLAGDLAAAVYSQGEAMRLYDHALELAEEAGDEVATATALERLGQVEMLIASYDESVDHLIRAADGYRRTGGLEPRLRVEGLIAEAQHRRGESELAAARLAEVVAELEVGIGSDGQAPGVASLAIGLARVRLSLGQHELCVEAAEHAAQLARKEGSVAAEADADGVAGTALLFLDRPDEAVTTLERAISLAAGVDALTVESGATLGLQWWVTMGGELGRARALGERGLEITRRAGNADMEALHAANLGLTLFYCGEWDRAQRHLERSVELARAGSPTLFSGIPPVYLGVLRAGQGDAAAATACYDEAATAPDLKTFAFAGYLEARRAELELRDADPATALARLEPWLLEEAPTRIHDVMLLSTAAEACLDLGDVARGEELVDRARRRASATRNAIDGVDADRLRGRCLLLQEHRADAVAWLHETLARAVALPHPGAEARVHRELARAFEADGDRATARQHLAAAVEIFGRLGAARDAAAAQEALSLA
jgi:transcriptional regulator with XRE-family HTH domain/tetratricopeptide (TPR) repeat protein